MSAAGAPEDEIPIEICELMVCVIDSVYQCEQVDACQIRIERLQQTMNAAEQEAVLVESVRQSQLQQLQKKYPVQNGIMVMGPSGSATSSTGALQQLLAHSAAPLAAMRQPATATQFAVAAGRPSTAASANPADRALEFLAANADATSTIGASDLYIPTMNVPELQAALGMELMFDCINFDNNRPAPVVKQCARCSFYMSPMWYDMDGQTLCLQCHSGIQNAVVDAHFKELCRQIVTSCRIEDLFNTTPPPPPPPPPTIIPPHPFFNRPPGAPVTQEQLKFVQQLQRSPSGSITEPEQILPMLHPAHIAALIAAIAASNGELQQQNADSPNLTATAQLVMSYICSMLSHGMQTNIINNNNNNNNHNSQPPQPQPPTSVPPAARPPSPSSTAITPATPLTTQYVNGVASVGRPRNQNSTRQRRQ